MEQPVQRLAGNCSRKGSGANVEPVPEPFPERSFFKTIEETGTASGNRVGFQQGDIPAASRKKGGSGQASKTSADNYRIEFTTQQDECLGYGYQFRGTMRGPETFRTIGDNVS